MSSSSVVAVAFGAGLAGSLHCIGMCGPLLVGFSQLVDGGGRRSAAWTFVPYHLGRIWTYGVLGLVVGLLGAGIETSAVALGVQRWASVALAIGVIASGLLLVGVIPGVSPDRWSGGCGVATGKSWLRTLAASDQVVQRLLLGAIMGLLPCGLVVAMLALAAATRSPLDAALVMLGFGLGTVPSLTAVLAALHLLPIAVRRHGTRIAAVVILLTGGWMLTRALAVSPTEPGCIGCASPPPE